MTLLSRQATVAAAQKQAPDAPTIGTATAGDNSASVTFTAPAYNGRSAITNYTVTSNPGAITQAGSSSPIVVSGLTTGTPYTFTVTATNAAGTSAASSASNSATPTSGSVGNLVQSASGSTGAGAPGSTVTATFSSQTKDGNQIFLAICSDATVPTPPTGFRLVASTVDINGLYLYHRTAYRGEQAYVITPSVAAATAWTIMEYEGIRSGTDPEATYINAQNSAAATVTTFSSNQTPLTDDTVGSVTLAIFGFTKNSATASVSSMTNGYTELSDVCTSRPSNSNVGIAVGAKGISSEDNFESTATFNTTTQAGAIVVAFRVGFLHGDELTSSNVGVPTGTSLTTHSGDWTITTPQTITDQIVTGRVYLQGNIGGLVTFRRCVLRQGIRQNGADYPAQSNQKFLLEDCEVGAATQATAIHDSSGLIAWSNYTLRRTKVWNCDEMSKAEGTILAEDCWYGNMVQTSAAEPHDDVIQTAGADPVDKMIWRRCHLDARVTYNQAGSNTQGNGVTQWGDVPQNGVYTMNKSWLAGGTYTLRMYDANHPSGGGLSYVVTDCKFLRNSWGSGPTTLGKLSDDVTLSTLPSQVTWINNTYTDNGSPVALDP